MLEIIHQDVFFYTGGLIISGVKSGLGQKMTFEYFSDSLRSATEQAVLSL